MESNVAQLPLSHQLLAWFDTNKKPVIAGSAAVVIVGFGIWFFLWQKSETENAAGEALAKITIQQANPVNSRGDAAEGFLKVAADYPNSAAGARALLLAAGSLFTDGKYAEAKTQFDKFVREHRDSPLVAQALLGAAAALDAQGKASEATTAYKELAERHSSDPVAPQAKFALGRLYEAQNKPDLARGMFEEVERADPFGSLGSEAGMRMEELLLKHPELAPKPVSATNSPAVVPVKK